MRPALDPAGHRVPQTKPTCLLHTWRPHRRRPFALVLHLHQHQSSRNLHLQYLAKNQSTQLCQSLITKGSDHPPVLEPHMVLRCFYRQLVQTSPCVIASTVLMMIGCSWRDDALQLGRVTAKQRWFQVVTWVGARPRRGCLRLSCGGGLMLLSSVVV
jgi:hypothetical protein